MESPTFRQDVEVAFGGTSSYKSLEPLLLNNTTYEEHLRSFQAEEA